MQTFEDLGKPKRIAFSLLVDTAGSMTFSYEEHKFCVPGLEMNYSTSLL